MGPDYLILIHLDAVHLLKRRGKHWRALGHADYPPIDDETTLDQALAAATEPMRAVVVEHRVRGAVAVLHQSPTQAVEMTADPTRSDGEAIESARLSCVTSLNYPAENALAEAIIVGRDRSGDDPRRHVVVVSERNDVAKAISKWVADLGLKLASLTPKPAAVLTAYLQRVLRETSDPRGWLYVSDHMSFFVLAEKGRIFFQRRIDVGLATLTHTLTTPIRLSGKDKPISLSARQAQQLIRRVGIPERGAWVDEEAGLRGAHLLPQMQPVLQRMIVEMRQSLRFGVTDEQREQFRLLVTGPGAAVHGLTNLIGDGLGVPTDADPAFVHQVGAKEAQGGHRGDGCDAMLLELDEATQSDSLWRQLNVMPAEQVAARQSSKLRGCLVAGACAAALLITNDFQQTTRRLEAAEQRRRGLEIENEDVQRIREISSQLNDRRAMLPVLQAAIRQEVGYRVDYRALLGEITHVTPTGVRVVDLSFSAENGQTQLVLSGDALADEAGGTGLAPFVRALDASPLVSNVILREVKSSVFPDGRGETFELLVSLVATPRDPELLKITRDGNERSDETGEDQ